MNEQIFSTAIFESSITNDVYTGIYCFQETAMLTLLNPTLTKDFAFSLLLSFYAVCYQTNCQPYKLTYYKPK